MRFFTHPLLLRMSKAQSDLLDQIAKRLKLSRQQALRKALTNLGRVMGLDVRDAEDEPDKWV
jgi:hypothetical protein